MAGSGTAAQHADLVLPGGRTGGSASFCYRNDSADHRHTPIKGKVKVEKGSAAGVAVILRRNDHEVRRVETDRKGEFAMARVPAGTYGLTFRKAGLAVESIDPFEVLAGKTRSLKDIVLPIDEGSIAFIRGSVFNEGGRSVSCNRDGNSARSVHHWPNALAQQQSAGELGHRSLRLHPGQQYDNHFWWRHWITL